MNEGNEKCILIVNELSYEYVKSVSNFISDILAKRYGDRYSMEIVPEVDGVDCSSTRWVFVLGDPFPLFTRNGFSFYIFINFSLLVYLGESCDFGRDGDDWIMMKRVQFEHKLRCFDAVIDYYPSQTKLLRKKYSRFPVTIESFPVNVPEIILEDTPLNERRYDVCIVGSDSMRREKLFNVFEKNGVSLSPRKTANLAETIRNSRIVINIHAYECNNLELPRIVESLQLGRCLLTESCYDLDKYIPEDCCLEVGYKNIVEAGLDLLSHPYKIEEYEKNSLAFMNDSYNPDSVRNWHILLNRLLSN